ncbi:MAG: UDP-N-acetylmuramate:L-alanyl-gamma-D-glutamyl-meso-diaminopimelate ligase [Pseudomonadales bacterium]
MHIHILGICGTFMGSMAILARELGYRVTGSDANVYPPMSTQLEEQGIELMQGYSAEHLQPAPDLVVVGNALSRGNAAVEYVLEQGLAYTSGAQWLSEHVLKDRWVLAVSGTHGKTTTASMLAWILEYANMAPGYLIGGIPQDFSVSARLGDTPFFVIEADEYDTAFFDKRSKFVHYRPRTLVINNLEYDHADIFADLDAIKRQFHHLVRIVPGAGQIIHSDQASIESALDMGCWSERVRVGQGGDCQWQASLLEADGTAFEVKHEGQTQAVVNWSLTGEHNVNNGLMALIAARHVGVAPQQAAQALAQFQGVKRRMERLAEVGAITFYDDFAHHPTAIATTLQGLRRNVGEQQIIAVIEPRSNTMRLGCHAESLAASTADADQVIWFQPEGMDWALQDVIACSEQVRIESRIEDILQRVAQSVDPQRQCHVVMMSNGGFQGIHGRIVRHFEALYDA